MTTRPNPTQLATGTPEDGYSLQYSSGNSVWTPSANSVFGRTGDITSATDDYSASQIENDSTVTGEQVSDALEYLDGYIGDVYTLPVGGDLSGFLPNPEVTDLSISGEEQGSILYFNGSNWVQLSPGEDGYILTTHGTGANTTWEPTTGATGSIAISVTPGTTNVTIPTNAVSLVATLGGGGGGGAVIAFAAGGSGGAAGNAGGQTAAGGDGELRGSVGGTTSETAGLAPAPTVPVASGGGGSGGAAGAFAGGAGGTVAWQDTTAGAAGGATGTNPGFDGGSDVTDGRYPGRGGGGGGGRGTAGDGGAGGAGQTPGGGGGGGGSSRGASGTGGAGGDGGNGLVVLEWIV